MTIGRNGNRSQLRRQKLGKARKLSQSRQALLESLELRQLMTVGPQLVAIQSNEGTVVSEGQILNTSPRELVFRFSDSSNIDPATLSGIQITRSGGDSAFDRAYVSTDLGTNGTVVMDFAAAVPGQPGNGTRVTFTSVAQATSGVPVLTVGAKSVNIQLNTLAGFKTTAQNILTAFQNSPAARSVVIASILRGVPTTVVADTAPVGQTLTLTGANTPKATTNLNAGAAVQVDFTASQPGVSGLNTRVVITSRNFGGPGLPNVSVVGQTINVQVNSNVNNATTLGEFVDAINSNTAAAQLLTARIASGLRSTRIGTTVVNNTTIPLGGLNDVNIVPGYIGLGDTPNEVIVRFAETLPDDIYRVDILGTGITALRGINGQAYNNGTDTSRTFELDLGALVASVVPQPVVTTNGVRNQLLNEIHVYFNNDDLNLQDARNPAFYQLRYLRGTVDSNDDLVVYPQTATYDAGTDRVVLRFARNLDGFASAAGVSVDAMRLRVGSRVDANKFAVLPVNALVAVPLSVPSTITFGPNEEPGDQFSTAKNLNTSGWTISTSAPSSAVLNALISNPTPYSLDFPGADSEPGNRKIRYQQHVTGVDADGIEVIEYNFQGFLGSANGSNQLNAITDGQKEIVRNIFDLYQNYLGVRFVETTSRGATIAVGDMRAIDSTAVNGLGGQTLINGTLLVNGQPAVIFDIQDSESSTNNIFGTELFRTFARGIGNLLGLGTADEVPGLTVQSNIPPVNPGIDTELVYPGNADIVYGQYMHRPESKDIDLYRFNIPARGEVRIEVSAERIVARDPVTGELRGDASLLDASLRLYRRSVDGSWTEVAANDNYFSEDSQIRLNLEPGDYIVGVSAKGNQTYDPNIPDSGLGGRSEGKYQLRLDFNPPQTASLRDSTGVAIDGDADGKPGGFFDFWFVPNNSTNTIFVNKNAPVVGANPQPVTGNGSLASPFNTIAQALAATSATRNVVRLLGNGGTDGDISTAGDNFAYEVGFNRLGQVQSDGPTFDVPANVTVMIDAGAIVKLSRAKIGVGSSTVSVDRSGGALQVLGIPRFIDSSGRVVADLAGNPVPGNVYFTSLNDSSVGIGTNRDTNRPPAAPADWGGIDIRNQVDASLASVVGSTRANREANGLFLNAIIHADLRFGGGSVVFDGVSQVITPIHMVDARPLIANSLISRSADAAISATPNSFLESNFQDPVSQARASALFISDLERVGPDIRGNRLTNNSVNGLFIKTRTNPTSTAEKITIPGRFNDTDIVHVISENLVIQGATGGYVATTESPSAIAVVATPSSVLGLTNGLSALTGPTNGYRYKFAFYTPATDFESPASASTRLIQVQTAPGVDSGQILLTGLPVLLPTQVLRIYRSSVVNGVESVSYLVGTTSPTQTTFTDNFAAPELVSATPSTISTVLATPPTGIVIGTTNDPLLTTGLVSGRYRYQIAYMEIDGSEGLPATVAQDAVVVTTVVGSATGRVTLDNLPLDTSFGAATRILKIYRASVDPFSLAITGGFQLVGALPSGTRTFVDSNARVALAPPAVPLSTLIPPIIPVGGLAPALSFNANSGLQSSNSYQYSYAVVNTAGAESARSSDAVVTLTAGVNTIEIRSLPTIAANETLRIYRSRVSNPATPPVVTLDQPILVGVVSSGVISFTDTDARIIPAFNTSVGTTIPTPALSVVFAPQVAVGANGTPSLVNALTQGTYQYQISIVETIVNPISGVSEFLESEPTGTLPSPLTTVNVTNTGSVANGTVTISNLPSITPTQRYRIYRALVTPGAPGSSSPFLLVAELPSTTTSFVDARATAGIILPTVSDTSLNDLAGALTARTNGSLQVDPGTVMKFQGSRIEVNGGGQFLAEGTDGSPIVMTSINDTRYGAGGTFDTANRRGTVAPVAGNFGGVFIGQASTGSFDFVRFAYGGGTTRIDGGFASFNAIEGHQAELRITNSRFENNASGIEALTPTNRAGRGTNFDATIFVRGSQPVIVDNRITNNASAAINIDVDSLNSQYVVDKGRQSGTVQSTRSKETARIDNQGPMIAGNELANNGINGMIVRGQTITTESVWDDADIVHVVRDEIISSNLYTYGGLRLKSNSSSSLVVKFGGSDATVTKGLTATGRNLDIADRIGGSVQIVGVPNFPVILTTIDDDSVGAGFTPTGIPVTDTDNNGAFQSTTTLPTIGEVNRGITIDNDVATNVVGHFEFTPSAGGEVFAFAPTSGITAQGTTQLLTNANVIFAFTNFVDLGADGGAIRLGSTTITLQPTLIAPDVVISEGTFVGNGGAVVSWRVRSSFENGVAQLVNTVTFTSSASLGSLRFVNYLDEDILSADDDLLFTTGTPGEADFRAFTIDGGERVGFSHGGVYLPGDGLINATFAGWAADQFPSLDFAITGAGTTYSVAGNINQANLPQFNDATIGTAFGPADVTTAFAWDVDPNATTSTITTFLELLPREVQNAVAPGGWRGLLFETGANDRNVSVVTERESAQTSAEARNEQTSPGNAATSNDNPSTGQLLGTLASSAKAGDENARLGYQIQGVINRPSDRDVYSFYADSGTEVWFDIDRTSNSLDTVVELIDANGNILVSSDNSSTEEAVGAVAFAAIDPVTGRQIVANPLRKSAIQTFPTDSRGQAKDLYSTNPKDAGFRVVLPGNSRNTLYQVRVRSSDSSQAGVLDSRSGTNGKSKGAYQLQIRLSEAQEFPGASVSFADIRFATTGIDLAGVPRHSPLLGEAAEQVDTATAPSNNTFATAQELGNLLQTDRATISVAGNLSSPTDVDWYTFTLDYQVLQTDLQRYFSTVFDVDYADGIGRPDTSVYLFNAAGNLLSQGLNSNILDDRAGALKGADNSDLSRGSAGTLDPFLGPIELSAGGTVASGRYFIAITNQGRIPTQVAAFNDPTNGNPLLRLQPSNNTQWIVEDRVGSVGGSTAQPPATTNFLPAASAAVPFSLSDVALYLSTDNGVNGTNIFIANPMTGTSDLVGTNGQDVNDIAFRYNGDLRGFNRVLTVPAGVDADGAVNYFHLNDATGVATSAGTLNLQTSLLDNQRALAAADVGFNIEAIAFGNFGFTNPAFGGPEVGLVVGNRPVTNALTDGVQSTRLPIQARGTNVVYRFNPDTGAAIGTGNFNGTINNVSFILGNGTEVDELGYIDTTTPSGLPSRRLTFIDATTFNSTAIPPITTPVLNDGDNFVIQLPTGQTRTFEFDTGPEFRLTLDPVNGPFLADGSTFTLSNGQSFEIQTNSTPVQAGARPILYNANMNNAQFAIALQAAMDLSGPQFTVQSNLGFGVGQDGSRFNIAGAGVLQGATGSFADPAVVNITNPGSATLNNPNAVQVTFLAQDTGAILAQKASAAINAQGFLGVSTSIVGDSVVLTGATIASTQGAIFQDQVAAGGTITGIAVQNVAGSPVFAISSTGGLYRVNTTLTANPGNIGTFVGQVAAPAGTVFTGLTAGPRTLQGGQYANLLFATTQSGSVFAFDTSGVLQPVFALGASSINTGRTNLNGLAFSTLDYNLFNVSNQRGADAGHGNPGSPDGIVTSTAGGQSWHFAYEGGNQNPNSQYDAVTNPSSQARFDAGPTTNTYNFPGGATGVLQSQPISLANIAAGDTPYFYFTYFSTTESANNTDNDLIRIKAIGDDGIWRELGNNDVDLNSPVIFNNSATQTGWKQARVNLAQFAGNQNVRFRFEFSTGGGISSDPGAELRVVPGNQLSDGQTFTVAGTVFEIDKGSSLIVPAGSSIANGSTLTVSGTTYTFRQGTPPLSPSATDIYYTTSQSASGMTGLIATAILASGPTVSGNRIQLATGSFALPAGSSFVVQGNAGTTVGNLPVSISETMSASEVAIAVRDALRASIGNGSTYDIFPTREEFISLPGVRAGVLPGPFTVNFPDPNLRQFATVANPSPTNRLVNNAFEGIYLDDFVIGVAERGETIGGSSTDTTFVANPNAIANSINVGAYQLEIRGGQEYGVPTQTGLQYPTTVDASLTGINTRLSLGATITLPNATGIVNGDSFTISDGNSSVLFVFSDTASPAPLPVGAISVPYSVSITNPRTGVIGPETASTLAGRLRDILNSSVIQSRLKITAISLTGAATGASGPELALSSNAVVTVPARPAGSTLAPVVSVTRYVGKGDSNTPRDQGQIIIENSKISDSAQYGIVLRPDARDPVSGGNNPSPGAVRNTVVLNTERLAPGAVIMNNEIIGNRVGGIQIVGDNAANTTVPSSIPFARIINNTIVGGSIIKTEVLGPQVFNDLLFPNGSISFADSVFSYLPNFSNGLAPAAGVAIATDALGIPNYTGGFAEPATGQGAVSLGSGGRLTVQFTDNLLTGSNDARPDLAIIEVGDSERAFVEVSADGVTYTSVGSISGTVRTIDLDFYGFNRDSRLRFVRITDDVLDGATTGETVGADIDAIGALSSVPATVYAAGGIGIDVGANTSPTLLNNIVVNSVTGLNVAAASTLNPNILVSTVGPVVGGMVFQRNTADIGGIATFGQSVLQPNVNVELFQDPANRIFYPNVGAPTIDSTIDSLLDRPGLIAVKQPLGLDLSPIIAPTYDLNGLLRVDDPTVNTPSGVGQNVFKDRGAQDRSDNLGPSAVLLLPTDNSTTSGDSNPLVGTVQISNQTLPYFEIRLIDGVDLGSSSNGSGIDAQSVSGAGIVVTRDDVELIQGVDYRFGFDATSNTIRLTPIAGVWTSDAVYKIRFVSAGESVIPLNTIANLADGMTYVILDANGDYKTFELDLGIRLTVPTVTNGTTQSLLDGSQFILSDGIQTLTYEFDSDGVFATNSVVIPILATETPAVVATRMIAAIRASGLNASVNSVSSDSIQVLGATVTLDSNTSRLRSAGSNGTISTSIPIVLNAGLLIDGNAVATAVADAIRAAALPGVTVSQNGQNLLLQGTQGVYGTGATVAGEIKDRAGNSLRANGDSGDTTLTIILADGFDYGDTPQPLYATSKVNNGPRHRIADGFYLGLGVSAEGDALPAGTDTLDDGVAFPATFVKGYSTSITVTAAGISADRMGYLNAWIDYNRDGVFADSERITNLGGRLLVNGNSNNLQVTIPGDVVPGTLNARFRYSSVATLGPLGEAADGEVEDYVITVGNNAYQNPTNQFDVNNDTFVSPIDVLQVINYLNRNPGQISTQLPINPTTPVPPYVDVNGDSFVTPLDVLLVINELNLRSRARSAGGEGESVSADTWISSSAQVASQLVVPATPNFASPQVQSVPTQTGVANLVSQSVSQPSVQSTDSGAASGSVVASLDNLWAASSSGAVDWLDEIDSSLGSLSNSESSNSQTVDGLFARLEGFGS